MPKIAIIGASGKLGGATLSALLAHGLVAAPRDVVALTSSAAGSPTRGRLAATGVSVRPARFEDPAGLEAALRGVDTLFLVSTPDIALDFGLAPDFDGTTAAAAAAAGGEGSGNGNHPGRESHHKNAVDAAVRAGVRRIVYSSLAFAFDPTASRDGVGVGNASKAGVMRAHLRTEAYLRAVAAADHGVKVVVLREGLYAESWPLYLGYFDNDAVVGDGEGEGEGEGDVVVPLAGDGKICWTAIRDLGVASALVLADADAESEFDGRTVYLATRPATAKTVAEIARLVAAAGGGGGGGGARDVRVEVVGRREHERYYVAERGLPRPAVEWWAGTYEALEAGECLVDDPTLETLLGRVGLTPTPVEEMVAAMVKGRGGWKSRQKEARIGG